MLDRASRRQRRAGRLEGWGRLSQGRAKSRLGRERRLLGRAARLDGREDLGDERLAVVLVPSPARGT